MDSHSVADSDLAFTPEPKVAIRLTRFEKPVADGPMTKTIKLGAHGQPVSDGSECRMWRGKAEVITVEGAAGLADAIGACASQQAFAMGVVKPELAAAKTRFNVVTKKALAGAPLGVIARTKECFEFTPGQPAAMPIDYDQKGMPPLTDLTIELTGGFLASVVDVAPEIEGAAHVMRSSTSAGLADARTGEAFPGSGGMHLFIVVKDGADIPRAIKTLHERARLKGYGWGLISTAGIILPRSIVDASKGAPHDLIFEGPAIVSPPLTQNAASRKPKANEGRVIDTRRAIPDLTPSERTQLKAIREAEKQELAEKARPIREAHIGKLVKHAVEVGSKTPIEILRERIEGAYAGRLPPEYALTFDDPEIGEVTVATVLSDPERYAGETLADPLEGIGYGPCKAKVMPPREGDDRVWIHSFAHGEMIYTLLIDQETLRAMIRNAPRDQAVEDFVRNVDRAALFAGGDEALLLECQKASGVKLTSLRRTLKAFRAKRDAERRAAQRKKNEAFDPRPSIPAPAPDAELGVVSNTVEGLLAVSKAAVPPFRGVNGRLAVMVDEPVSGLHLLDSANVNPVEEEDETTAVESKPPPPETRLVELTSTVNIAMELERHLRFTRIRKDSDETVYVRADGPVCEAVNSRLGKTRLSIVKAVQTLPLVYLRDDGTLELIIKEGVDPRLGVYMHVPPEIAEAMPDPARVTVVDAERAYGFLTDKWLVDVDCDRNSQAVLVSIPLTTIERMLFVPARPGFMVTGPQQGTGKTTVISMGALTVFGQLASAAAWAEHDEEIRKSLFSYLLAGKALLVWDNIKRGTRITSPTVERVLTAEFMEDRILGLSKGGKAPANTIQVWTGNDIGPKGEMASRCFTAKLRASRADPENRDFRHPDPFRWTLDHRAEILNAMYTILCVPRSPRATAMTRMKDWFRLVGRPVEIAAGVNFMSILKANNANDPTLGALERLVSWLRDTFGSQRFDAHHVAKGLRLDPGIVFADSDQREAAQAEIDARRDAFAELTNRGFPPGDPTTQAVGKKLAVLEDRPCEIDRKTWKVEKEIGMGHQHAYRISMVDQDEGN